MRSRRGISGARTSSCDARLQANRRRSRSSASGRIIALDDFEGTREYAKNLRNRALEDLDVGIELFEKNATARGATVLFAETPADINALVLEIAKKHGVAKIIKSKSMVSEESALDHAIEAAGLTVVETDLGEYILQINGYEPPSHIIGPALHKSKEEVAELFARKHGTPLKDGIEELCLEARGGEIRPPTAGRQLVAETGSVVLVTNEGNATLATTLPKVHVAIFIEKIVPRSSVATLMRRCRARRPASPSELRRTPVRRGRASFTMPSTCISSSSIAAPRCASGALRAASVCACTNHCPAPTERQHSYGWVIPTDGSILTPCTGLELRPARGRRFAISAAWCARSRPAR